MRVTYKIESLKNQLIRGEVTRQELIDMAAQANDMQPDSLHDLTDGQLIDMICIKD
jgi:antitoxin component of MazEF toxin-antitoxin module